MILKSMAFSFFSSFFQAVKFFFFSLNLLFRLFTFLVNLFTLRYQLMFAWSHKNHWSKHPWFCTDHLYVLCKLSPRHKHSLASGSLSAVINHFFLAGWDKGNLNTPSYARYMYCVEYKSKLASPPIECKLDIYSLLWREG